MEKNSTSYADAGVDIEKANALVSNIRKIADRTRRAGVMGSIGGFGALFEIPNRYRQPILVSGTDGVGTKLKLAIDLNIHHTIGIDLVAMCVNDVACLGAEPLFFLDYFATGKLNSAQAQEIITGIGKGCEIAGAALIGGETAEMPGLYHESEYDLAGFCVGVVEKEHIIDGSRVQVGDSLIAVASSGAHSNGFSLIRHILHNNQISLQSAFGQSTVGEVLLTPTRIYVPALKALQKTINLHAIAHITGGGLIDNLPRVLPPHTKGVIDTQSWRWPEIFQWLQEIGKVRTTEMYRTFNVGVGLIICISKRDTDQALDILHASGENAWICGQVESHPQAAASIDLQ